MTHYDGVVCNAVDFAFTFPRLSDGTHEIRSIIDLLPATACIRKRKGGGGKTSKPSSLDKKKNEQPSKETKKIEAENEKGRQPFVLLFEPSRKSSNKTPISARLSLVARFIHTHLTSVQAQNSRNQIWRKRRKQSYPGKKSGPSGLKRRKNQQSNNQSNNQTLNKDKRKSSRQFSDCEVSPVKTSSFSWKKLKNQTIKWSFYGWKTVEFCSFSTGVSGFRMASKIPRKSINQTIKWSFYGWETVEFCSFCTGVSGFRMASKIPRKSINQTIKQSFHDWETVEFCSFSTGVSGFRMASKIPRKSINQTIKWSFYGWETVEFWSFCTGVSGFRMASKIPRKSINQTIKQSFHDWETVEFCSFSTGVSGFRMASKIPRKSINQTIKWSFYGWETVEFWSFCTGVSGFRMASKIPRKSINHIRKLFNSENVHSPGPLHRSWVAAGDWQTQVVCPWTWSMCSGWGWTVERTLPGPGETKKTRRKKRHWYYCRVGSLLDSRTAAGPERHGDPLWRSLWRYLSCRFHGWRLELPPWPKGWRRGSSRAAIRWAGAWSVTRRPGGHLAAVCAPGGFPEWPWAGLWRCWRGFRSPPRRPWSSGVRCFSGGTGGVGRSVERTERDWPLQKQIPFLTSNGIQPKVLMKSMVRLVAGMDGSRTRHGERRFSYSFIGTVRVWTNFWPSQNFETDHVLSSRIFILEKGPLGAAIQKWLDQKIRKKYFFEHFCQNFCHSKEILCQRNPTWTQKNIVFEMGWTWVTRSTSDFSEASHNRHKPLQLHAKFSIRSRKKLHFKILGRVAPEAWAKSSFSGMKTLGDRTWLFSECSQRPKVDSLITLTIEKTKNDVPFCRVHEVAMPDERRHAEFPLANEIFLFKAKPLSNASGQKEKISWKNYVTATKKTHHKCRTWSSPT